MNPVPFVFAFFIISFVQGCTGSSSDAVDDLSFSRVYRLQGTQYDAVAGTYNILGHNVGNVYQVSSSPDNRKAILSVVEPGSQPDIFIASIDSDSISRVTSNESIEFDPTINNNGNYAYALHENSVTQSSVFLDGDLVDLPSGLYKNLSLHGNTLVMHYMRHNDETSWLIVYDVESKTKSQIPIDVVPDYISFHSHDSVIIQGLNTVNYRNEILLYNIDSNVFSSIGGDGVGETCFLGEHKFGGSVELECFKEDQIQERLLFLGVRDLKKNDPTVALACSNNYLGRQSWNVSYRLEGLISLYASNHIVDYPVQSVVQSAAECLVSEASLDIDFVGWPTRKYSISGSDKLNLLVDGGRVMYPLLLAVNQDLLSEVTREKVISLAEDFYDFHESDYNAVTKNYHFKKGIPFWADGLWLPFNMQNSFGLSLIELYYATNNEKYKRRALELADKFYSEWVHLGDSRTLWRYWPQDFYNGWSAAEGLSVNSPSGLSLIHI